jgi:Protein of unknown function (DUF4238)
VKHHYVPEFYLKKWADPDGRVPHYRWLNGRVILGRRAPEYIGFEPDLYAREHVPPEERHKVETHFFSVLDSRAAIIHGRLVRREQFTFTDEERMDWAIFLAAANARTPDMIAHLKKTMSEAVRANLLSTDPKEVEKALGYKPPFTLLEWTEKHFPDQIANFHLRMLLKYLTRQELVQQFMGMDWTIHEVQSRHKELLTCDRPLWYFGKPEHPKFALMMTLSPRTVFIAANTIDLANKMAATPSMRLARLINESVFNRAFERVYGRTTLEYATKYFRRLSRRNRTWA